MIENKSFSALFKSSILILILVSALSCKNDSTSPFVGNERNKVNQITNILTNLSFELNSGDFTNLFSEKTPLHDVLNKIQKTHQEYDVNNWRQYFEQNEKSTLFCFYRPCSGSLKCTHDGYTYICGNLYVWAESPEVDNLRELTLTKVFIRQK